MKKLYEVEVKYYVLAEDLGEARETYPDHISNCTIEASEANSVDADWWDNLPFGDDDSDRTCGEILKEQRQ